MKYLTIFTFSLKNIDKIMIIFCCMFIFKQKWRMLNPYEEIKVTWYMLVGSALQCLRYARIYFLSFTFKSINCSYFDCFSTFHKLLFIFFQADLRSHFQKYEISDISIYDSSPNYRYVSQIQWMYIYWVCPRF